MALDMHTTGEESKGGIRLALKNSQRGMTSSARTVLSFNIFPPQFYPLPMYGNFDGAEKFLKIGCHRGLMLFSMTKSGFKVTKNSGLSLNS